MEDTKLTVDMDGVRRKIARRKLQKRRGDINVWSMTATIREENYDVVLTEGDNSETESVSKVVNRALTLMQRLMDSTQTNTFSEAVEVALRLLKQAHVTPTDYRKVVNPSEDIPEIDTEYNEYIDPDFMNVMG